MQVDGNVKSVVLSGRIIERNVFANDLYNHTRHLLTEATQPMRGSKTKSLARKKADRYFSKYIRKRDTDHRGIGYCITCSKPVSLENADAGHFIRRDRQATRYDERNVNLQCRRCNRFKSGEQYQHGKAIDEKYGEGTADELLQKSKMRCKRTKSDFEWLAKEFKDKL